MDSSQNFKPALLVVDMQEDFCPPKGSLAVEGGRDLAQGINRLLKLPFALKVATRDWHPKDHASFASNQEGPNNEPFEHKTTMTNPENPAETKESMLWPVHCVQDTTGAAIIPEIDTDRFDLVVSKGQDARMEMYSAFNDIFGNNGSKTGASVDIASVFKQKHITHVYACGLTGDICVFENAMGARKAGFEVVVLQDLIRSVDRRKESVAKQMEEDAGIVVASTTGAEVARVENLA